MKRILSLLMACAMVLALAACGNTNEPQETPAGSPAGENTGSPAESPEAEPVELIVFAAASMTETLTEISDLYAQVAPHVTLTFNLYQEGSDILEQAVINLGQSDIEDYAETLTQLFGEPTETYEKSYFFVSDNKTLVLADPYGDGASIEISLGEIE